jgi:hypothetical protein
MPEIAIKDSRKPQGGQRHQECLRSLSSLRIAGSLEEASDIEDAQIAIEDSKKPEKGREASRMPRPLSRIARRLNKAEKHRECLRLLSSITGSPGFPDEAKNPLRRKGSRERSSGSLRVLPRVARIGSAWNTWYFGRVTHRRKPHGNPGIISREMTRWKP